MINILFGGTFDPIHLGHLGIAEAVLKNLPVEKIYFIPCHQPTHRETPFFSIQDRLTMLKLAIGNHPHFLIDESEIHRDAPSYAIDTINDFQKRFPEKTFAWLLGYDAFLNFLSWHQWEEIIKKVHLIVVSRPSLSLPQTGPLYELLNTHLTDDKNELLKRKAGRIFLLTDCHFNESATNIREQGLKKSMMDLPASVKTYIEENRLCTKRN